MAVVTSREHRARAREHRAAARAAQTAIERGAHYAAARAHEAAARDRALAGTAAEYTEQARRETHLRQRLGRILSESLRGRRKP